MKSFFGKYNIWRIIRTLGVAVIVVILYFAVKRKENTTLDNVFIEINTIDKDKLINKKDILKYLKKTLNNDLESTKIKAVDIAKIESLLDKSRYIQDADVYIDKKNNLHISCTLRSPVVRVKRKHKKDFYLDYQGNPVPVSKRTAVRVPVISSAGDFFNLSKIHKENTMENKILTLSKKIYDDPFLYALIEQIYVDKNEEIILIPKLGKQKIEFGKIENIDRKLNKLKVFYKEGMSRKGWTKYSKLSLKWDNQIVGTF